jgi:hypothetical protein
MGVHKMNTYGRLKKLFHTILGNQNLRKSSRLRCGPHNNHFHTKPKKDFHGEIFFYSFYYGYHNNNNNNNKN